MRTQDSLPFIMAELSNLVALRVSDLGEDGIRKNPAQRGKRVLLEIPREAPLWGVIRVDAELVPFLVPKVL
jgi:hypothetical protein